MSTEDLTRVPAGATERPAGTARGVGGNHFGSTRPRSRPGLRSLIGLGVVAALLSWAAVVGVTVWRAAHELQRGIDAADRVRHQLAPDDLSADAPAAQLARAESAFQQAHQLLSRSYVVPLRYVPIVGRQLRSVTSLAGAATTVSQIGSGALRQVHATLKLPHHSGADRLRQLRSLDAIAVETNSRLRRVQLGPSQALIQLLASKRAQFASDLNKVTNGVSQAQAATTAFIDFFGNSRTYLVLAANNAEMRDGSGMFLQAGTMSTTADGKFDLSPTRSVSDLVLPPPGLAISGDLAARWGAFLPNREWRNLALSPQFDTNAALASRMWTAKTGQHVDGVIAVDIGALKEALAATGPVSAAGTRVDASSVERYLLHDQYLTTGANTPTDVTARHDHLGVLATAIFNAVNRDDIPLQKLGPDLARAAVGRHILAWSADPAIESAWAAAGVGGRLQPNDVLLGVSNRGADKLDPFLAVTSRLDIHALPPLTTVDVRVTIRNDTPGGEPTYIAGPGVEPGTRPGDYFGFLTLDFPARAGRAVVVGSPPLIATGSDGPSRVLATPVIVKRGEAVVVTFRLQLDGAHGQLQVDPSSRLPATSWLAGPARFTDDKAHSVTW